jgi:hypothetical protein
MQKTSIILVIVLVILAGISLFVMNMSQVTKSSNNTPPPQSEPLASAAMSITVDDQVIQGELVIREVAMPENGYAVIHAVSKEEYVSGAIGNSLLLTKGMHTNIPIRLYGKDGVPYTNVKADDRFVVMLYKENGDNAYGGEDLLLPIRDEQGNQIAKQFKAL